MTNRGRPPNKKNLRDPALAPSKVDGLLDAVESFVDELARTYLRITGRAETQLLVELTSNNQLTTSNRSIWKNNKNGGIAPDTFSKALKSELSRNLCLSGISYNSDSKARLEHYWNEDAKDARAALVVLLQEHIDQIQAFQCQHSENVLAAIATTNVNSAAHEAPQPPANDADTGPFQTVNQYSRLFKAGGPLIPGWDEFDASNVPVRPELETVLEHLESKRGALVTALQGAGKTTLVKLVLTHQSFANTARYYLDFGEPFAEDDPDQKSDDLDEDRFGRMVWAAVERLGPDCLLVLDNVHKAPADARFVLNRWVALAPDGRPQLFMTQRRITPPVQAWESAAIVIGSNDFPEIELVSNRNLLSLVANRLWRKIRPDRDFPEFSEPAYRAWENMGADLMAFSLAILQRIPDSHWDGTISPQHAADYVQEKYVDIHQPDSVMLLKKVSFLSALIDLEYKKSENDGANADCLLKCGVILHEDRKGKSYYRISHPTISILILSCQYGHRYYEHRDYVSFIQRYNPLALGAAMNDANVQSGTERGLRYLKILLPMIDQNGINDLNRQNKIRLSRLLFKHNIITDRNNVNTKFDYNNEFLKHLFSIRLETIDDFEECVQKFESVKCNLNRDVEIRLDSIFLYKYSLKDYSDCIRDVFKVAGYIRASKFFREMLPYSGLSVVTGHFVTALGRGDFLSGNYMHDCFDTIEILKHYEAPKHGVIDQCCVLGRSPNFFPSNQSVGWFVNFMNLSARHDLATFMKAAAKFVFCKASISDTRNAVSQRGPDKFFWHKTVQVMQRHTDFGLTRKEVTTFIASKMRKDWVASSLCMDLKSQSFPPAAGSSGWRQQAYGNLPQFCVDIGFVEDVGIRAMLSNPAFALELGANPSEACQELPNFQLKWLSLMAGVALMGLNCRASDWMTLDQMQFDSARKYVAEGRERGRVTEVNTTLASLWLGLYEWCRLSGQTYTLPSGEKSELVELFTRSFTCPNLRMAAANNCIVSWLNTATEESGVATLSAPTAVLLAQVDFWQQLLSKQG